MISYTYWDILAGWILKTLGGSPAEQEGVLQGDVASIRAALKRTGKKGVWETMDDEDFMKMVETARDAVEG